MVEGQCWILILGRFGLSITWMSGNLDLLVAIWSLILIQCSNMKKLQENYLFSVSILSGLSCRISEHQIFSKFSYHLLWKPYRWPFYLVIFCRWRHVAKDLSAERLAKVFANQDFQSVRVFDFCLKRFAAKLFSTIYKKTCHQSVFTKVVYIDIGDIVII